MNFFANAHMQRRENAIELILAEFLDGGSLSFNFWSYNTLKFTVCAK